MPKNQVEVGIGLRDRLSKDLKKASSGIRRFSTTATGSFKKLGGAIFNVKTLLGGLAAGLVVRRLSGMVNETAGLAANIGKISKELGVSTEFLSEMRFVAARSGVEFDETVDQLRTVSEFLAEFQRAGDSTPAEVFGILNIEEAARQAKDLEAFIGPLSVGFETLGDSIKSTDASVKFFGDTGAQTVRIWKQGSEVIKRLREEARDLGVTMGKEDVEAALAFKQALVGLQFAFEGLRRAAILPLLPALAKLFGTISKAFLEKQGAIKDAIDGIAESIKTIDAKDATDGLASIGQVALTLAESLIVANQGILALINGFRALKLAGRKGLESFADIMDSLAGTSGKPTDDFQAATRALERRILAADKTIDQIGKLRKKLGELGGAPGGPARSPIYGLRPRGVGAPGVDGLLGIFGAAELSAVGRDAAESRGLSGVRLRSELDRAHREFLRQVGLGDAAKQTIRAPNGDFPNLAGGPPGSIFNVVATGAEKAEKEVRKLNPALEGARQALEQIHQEGAVFNVMRDSVLAVNDTLRSTLVNSLDILIDRTEDTREAFTNLAKGILRDLASIANDAIIRQLLGAVAGGIANRGFYTGGQQGFSLFHKGGVGDHGAGEMIVAHGREAHVPLPDGKTIPVTISGGGGGATVQNVTFNITATDAASFDEQWQAAFARNSQPVTEAVLERYNDSRGYRGRFS